MPPSRSPSPERPHSRRSDAEPPGGTTRTSRPTSMGGPPERLRRRADFSEVMRKGRRAQHPVLHLVALRTDLDAARVGYSVGKQVGGAVVRNRVRRRLRAIVRSLDWTPGVDAVFVARTGADAVSYGELQSIVTEHARKLRLIEEPSR